MKKTMFVLSVVLGVTMVLAEGAHIIEELPMSDNLPANFDCNKDLAGYYNQYPRYCFFDDRALSGGVNDWYKLFHLCKQKNDPLKLLKNNIQYARENGYAITENPYRPELSNSNEIYRKENRERIRWFKTAKALNKEAAKYLMEANGFDTDFDEIERNIGGVPIAYLMELKKNEKMVNELIRKDITRFKIIEAEDDKK